MLSDFLRIKKETKEIKILVLYTGGTFGMIRDENEVLVPVANALEQMIRSDPRLHDQSYAASRNHINAELVLPSLGPDAPRILYEIREYSPLLDSSNMTANEWIYIAKDIKEFYDYFDGFVVIHGTDTLCYTASALSFMLENVGKPVIITGSQIPFPDLLSDAPANFLGALMISGKYSIPEVCIYFNRKLFRGNRTVKRSNGSLDAFDSPNYPLLAYFDTEDHVDVTSMLRPMNSTPFQLHSTLNQNVILLPFFPSITVETLEASLRPPVCGVVLQTYGSGNIPSNRRDIIDALRRATERGVLMINTTQCYHGTVQAIYETGEVLGDAGVLPGADMTPEAALTKLAYVLSKDDWDFNTKRQMMVTNLRGELTA